MTADELTYQFVRSGSFKGGQLVSLLKDMKRDRLTGELSISSRDGDGFFVIYQGYITTVFSPGMYKTLKRRLVQSEGLDEAQAKELLEIQKTGPSGILESLPVREGYLSGNELSRIIKDNSSMVLRGMFSWGGLYRFYDDDYPDVPQGVLIDIEEVEKEEPGISRLRKERALADVPLRGLFTSVLERVGDRKGLKDAEIEKSFESLSRRLASFKAQEIVVVAEEDPRIRNAVADGLAGFGFEVGSFDGARAALERIVDLETQRIPLVVVTDLVMKGLYDEDQTHGGRDIIEYVRDNHPYVPIIVIASTDEPQIKLKTLFLGASYFLTKPEMNGSNEDVSRSRLSYFVEELSYYIWNLLRARERFTAKEEVSFAEAEIIDHLLETTSLPESEMGSLLNKRVLVADDEPNIRTSVQEYLERDGFSSVDTAEDGVQAVASFGKNRHDVVVVDIIMPQKDGIEVLQEIKTKSPNTQVIIITGNADKDSAILAVRYGAFDYIEKPFDMAILSKTVMRAIGKKALLDEMRPWR
jgi:DNA-binding response OmpR family regulator